MDTGAWSDNSFDALFAFFTLSSRLSCTKNSQFYNVIDEPGRNAYNKISHLDGGFSICLLDLVLPNPF